MTSSACRGNVMPPYGAGWGGVGFGPAAAAKSENFGILAFLTHVWGGLYPPTGQMCGVFCTILKLPYAVTTRAKNRPPNPIRV